jgi:WD40 repeat protein
VTGLRWSKAKSCLISGSTDYTVRVFDPRAPTKEQAKIALPAKCVALDALDTQIVVAMTDKKITFIDLAAADKLTAKTTRLTAPFTSVAMTPDGKGCVIGAADGSVEIWNGLQQSGIALHTDPAKGMSWESNCIRVLTDPGKAGALSGGGDGKVVMFDWVKAHKGQERVIGQTPVTAVAAAFGFYAVALGADWSRGAAGPKAPVELSIRKFAANEFG